MRVRVCVSLFLVANTVYRFVVYRDVVCKENGMGLVEKARGKNVDTKPCYLGRM